MIEKDERLETEDGKISLSLLVLDYPVYAKSSENNDEYRNFYIIPSFQ